MSNPQLDFEVFEKPSICVFVTLKEYISRTHTLMTDSQSKLLLSYIKPYHQVSIGMMLYVGFTKFCFLADLDKSIYVLHSTGAASVSAASKASASLHDILQTTGWSSAYCFAK